MYGGVSLAKPHDQGPNEDAWYASEDCIAVSDGAGGCGLYVHEWSAYLIQHLPKGSPIRSYEELDRWVDDIWEAFYTEHEERARMEDGTLLGKFYKEGSCATIAAAWMAGKEQCLWMAYGDSVVFHYSQRTGRLEHSFTTLPDFSNPPMLVSCKDPMDERGFRNGCFQLDKTSVLFAASDALAHYILMMYELSECMEYREELAEEYLKSSANTRLLRMAETSIPDFWSGVLQPLLHATASPTEFARLMQALLARGVLDTDDYTLACMGRWNDAPDPRG